MEEVKIEAVLPIEDLSEETIEAALAKDFKAKDGSSPEKIREKLEATPNRKVPKLSSLKNLRQYSPKEVSDESKLTIINNLRSPSMYDTKEEIQFPESVRNPEMIRNCLTKDEMIYFIDRWTEYYKQYGGDLNSANDYDQMVELVMCLIDQYRISKKKKASDKLTLDPLVDQIVHRIHGRIQALLASLSTRRKDRVQQNSHNEENLVKLLLEKARGPDFAKDLSKRIADEEKEELSSLKEKIKRGTSYLNANA